MEPFHRDARGGLNKPLVVALLGLCAVAAAIALNYFVLSPKELAERPSASPPQATSSNQPAAPDAREAPAPGAAASLPSFDVVRINPQGDTVMAGRAEPGSKIAILDGESVIGEIETDINGEWIYVPEQPLAPGQRRLTLRMDTPGGAAVASDETVVLIVPEPGKDIAGRAATPDSRALALRLGPGGRTATVLQSPTAAREPPPVSIGAVDYTAAGNFTVSGSAAPGSTIQLYLDNALIGRARSTAEGNWRIAVDEPIKRERFSLRADEVTDSGRVVARVAVPFSHAAAGGLELGPAETSMVVQPGANLWRIARRALGSGVAYTALYEANKSQIVDPNLIYPGQVFSVPSGN